MRVLGALLSLAKHGLLLSEHTGYTEFEGSLFQHPKYFYLVGSWCKTDLMCLGSLYQFVF